MKFLLTSVLFVLLFSTTAHAEKIDTDRSLIKPIEQIVVNGRRPGPPLWQIRNGENTLWVFAVVDTMPKSIEWDSSGIDHVLSESQQYFPPIERSLSASILNPIKAIGMLRRFNKLKKIPDERTIKDYLSVQEYDKFSRLKAQYVSNNKKIDKLTPVFAADELFKGAKREYGLVNSRKISKAISKLAKRNKLEITKIKAREKIESKPLFEAIESLSEAEHSECLSLVMNTLDDEIGSLISYALQWADGDPKALIDNSMPRVQDSSCAEFFLNSDQAQRIIRQSEEAWLNATQEALKNNRSSFAVLGLHDVIEPEGLLNQLATRSGYKLLGPIRNADPNTEN
jgi:uncharacterized protein YbaP (TraB family)